MSDAPDRTILFKKLVKVLAGISRVPKSGRNKFHSYDYVKEEDLVDHIRPKLAEAGVFLFTSIESVGAAEQVERKNSDGRIVNIETLHTFVCADTGAEYSVKGAGCGEDSGDKALYKAITGAEKYMLMKNFLVATGDDPEVDSPAPAVKVATAPAKVAAPPPAAPDIRFFGIVEEKKTPVDGGGFKMVYTVKEGDKQLEVSCFDAEVQKVISAAREGGTRVKVTVKTSPEGKVKAIKAEPETQGFEIKPPVHEKARVLLKGAEETIGDMLAGKEK